jgi:hypothetical protein
VFSAEIDREPVNDQFCSFTYLPYVLIVGILPPELLDRMEDRQFIVEGRETFPHFIQSNWRKTKPLAIDQCGTSGVLHKRLMDQPFGFKCPITDESVQVWLETDEDAPDSEFEGMICPACTRLHFVNRRTGKLLPDNTV